MRNGVVKSNIQNGNWVVYVYLLPGAVQYSALAKVTGIVTFTPYISYKIGLFYKSDYDANVSP